MWHQMARVVLFLSCLAFVSLSGCGESGSRETPEQAARRITGTIEEIDRAMGREPAKFGKATPPPGLSDAVDKYSPIHLFRMASGYYVSLNIYPALYASGSPEGTITIVAPQYEKQYPVAELDKAFEDYRRVLREQGYLPRTDK